ncbi:MAG: translation elongation factor Ts [Nitrospirota bacterium]
MAAVDAALVKQLRERTGAGMMDCKQALERYAGDLDKAAEWLRERGAAVAAKKADRAASEGMIGSYVHAGGKIGVMVEVNCETDFVARNPEFQTLVRDLAMHIAGTPTTPRYITRKEIPESVLIEARERFTEEARQTGKPDKVIAQIVQGRLDKFSAEISLMEQPFVKDPSLTIDALVTEKIAKIGERISVRRFVRYRLGEDDRHA